MTALDQVISYLSNKIGKVNINNPKANTAGSLIKSHTGWEDKIEKLVMIAFQNIQSQFTRKHPDYLPGECALTSISMTIGKHVGPYLQRDPLEIKHQLALGDLLIEGFAYHGFIELLPPKRRSESYVVKAAPKWAELADIPDELVVLTITGSERGRPESTSKNTRSVCGRTIGIHKMHEDLFDLEAPYVKAIDNLQKTNWMINERVLNTVLANPVDNTPGDNPEKEQKRVSKAIERKFIEAKAKALSGDEGFYQYFDVDYRGRIYNIEPFLNYQSSDLAKGMLAFGEYKEVNDSGRFWLAVHTAASYNESYDKDNIPDWCEEDYVVHLNNEELDNISVDKMTLNDRANWTINNMDRILAWAKSDSIQDCEKPITFLACCYEWEAGAEISNLPIPIDGSNNGWQHLGAISKDSLTGDLVGLSESRIQKDFYVQTAKELINLTTDERLAGILASMPMKHIRKGISKRGSMTRAYSAGANKIADNMYFDCKTEDFHEKYGITKKDCKKLASTLVKAIENVCPGPLQTMKYLQELAKHQLGQHDVVGPGGSKEFKALRKRRKELLEKFDRTDEEDLELSDTVVALQDYGYELVYGLGEKEITWDTPSGFKAHYEKFTMLEFKQRATLNGKQINHVLNHPTDKPDTQGFMCGISPNYIHSMDAAHMALVIADWDGDFGAVHDSFSTHANDVDELLLRTKQVFINMYDHDNFFDVIREKITNNTDNVEQPVLGDLNIKEIEDSDYFFA